MATVCFFSMKAGRRMEERDKEVTALLLVVYSV